MKDPETSAWCEATVTYKIDESDLPWRGGRGIYPPIFIPNMISHWVGLSLPVQYIM